MTNLGIKAYFALMNAKNKIANFGKSEKGGSEIIAIVLVIAVVLVLAGVFWEEIEKFFTELINKTFKSGNDVVGDILG